MIQNETSAKKDPVHNFKIGLNLKYGPTRVSSIELL